MFIQKIKPYLNKLNNFKLTVQKSNFCDFKIQIGEIQGIIKPKLPKSKSLNNSKKNNPKEEMFYGIPFSQEVPKSREDLLKKIDYLSSFDDMIDLFIDSNKQFDGICLTRFLERLFYISQKETRSAINKSREQQSMFKTETQIKSENEERINLFLEEVAKFSEEKYLSFKELLLVYFEVTYRFRKEIPQQFVDIIFEESRNEAVYEKEMTKEELLKLSFILSKYRMLLKTKSEAEAGLELVTRSVLKIGIVNFNKDELYEFINNLSKVFPDLEFFTRAEPHVLRYLQDYSLSTLVNIFSIYVKNYLGSNFFISTLGFSLASNIKSMNLREITTLLDLSNKKYFNRPELNIGFNDLFLDLFSSISPLINNLKARDVNLTLKGMINSGYNDKKFLHLLSTVYLKWAEGEELQRLIYMFYYFSVLDLDNSIFASKALEVLSLNLLCVNNYLDGNENLNNLQGIYDKDFIKKLGYYNKNVDSFKNKLKNFETIQYNEDEIFHILDSCAKMIWSITFFVSKLKNFDPENFKEFINNAIRVFNHLVSHLKTVENRVQLISSNIDKLLQAYFYLMLNSTKFSIKNNINLELVNLDNLELLDNSDEVHDYDNFVLFKEKVKQYIKNNEELQCLEVEYAEDMSDINNYDVFKYLKSDFVRIKQDPQNVAKSTELIFINNPYDYFEMSMNYTGYNKFRKHLCGLVKLSYVEIDYSEFMLFFKDVTMNEENYDQLIHEFLTLKLS